MKRSRIVGKLFVVTTSAFIIFLATAILCQGLFFEKFYINDKRENLRKQVEAFSSAYTENQWGMDELGRRINNFVDQNNALIAVLDETGMTKYVNSYKMVIKTDVEQTITIPLDNIAYLEDFQTLNLQIGSSISVQGSLSGINNQQTLYPSNIAYGDKQWQSKSISMLATAARPIEDIGNTFIFSSGGVTLDSAYTPIKINSISLNPAGVFPVTPNSIGINIEEAKLGTSQAVAFVGVYKVEGKVVQLDVPQKSDSMALYKRGMLQGALDEWVWILKSGRVKSSPEDLTYDYFDVSNGEKSVVSVRPLLDDAGNVREWIFAVASLQPVGEAIGVMKSYYIYVFLIALIAILALSLIYSKMIAKPLINMNNVAGKMAELDFSQECNVKSNDELGNLALSLNTLSRNLQDNMAELKTANDQLVEDIEKEREREAIRKEFVSNVSHELKTPLGVIQAFAEGLKDGIGAQKQDAYLNVILDETDKMNRLVLDMLDLSKLESKALKLNWEIFSLPDLVQGTVKRFMAAIEEKQLKVTLGFESDDYWVQGDEERIEQVLTNLLSNAVRHTPLNGSIMIGGYLNGPDKLCCYVQNSGEPIAESKLERIWDRFYRIEDARDRKSGGTGLGLAIVKNILELHQSEYGAENTEDGVKFYFTLNIASEWTGNQ